MDSASIYAYRAIDTDPRFILKPWIIASSYIYNKDYFGADSVLNIIWSQFKDTLSGDLIVGIYRLQEKTLPDSFKIEYEKLYPGRIECKNMEWLNKVNRIIKI